MPTLVQSPVRPYAITEAPDMVQTEEPLMRLREDLQQRKRKWANHPCPQCNSARTRRRHRSSWERLFSYFSDKRPYICSDCDADFFAHPSAQLSQKLAYTDEDLVKSSCFNQQREGDNV
jgi:transposase-like protein